MKEIWVCLRRLLPLLPSGARRFFIGYIVITSLLPVLDVTAMALLALTIAPAVNRTPISLPVIGEVPLSATPLLILIACALIVLKSALSLLLHWIATRRFARYELSTGERLFRAYVHSSWEDRSRRSVAEITRIADSGISAAIRGFLLPLSLIPSYALTFLLVLGVLIIADPVTAVVALVYLALISLLVTKVISRRAVEAATVDRDYTYRVATLMTEMVEALKELTLRNKLDQIVDVVTSNRRHAVRGRANSAFLVVIPLYTFEMALVGGFVLIGFSAYLIGGLSAAVASVALFAATGFRLLPAINGIQGNVITSLSALPVVKDVIGDLDTAERSAEEVTTLKDSKALPERPQMLQIRDLSFTYPGASESVLRGFSLDIPLGSSLGIVGPSGAGKSTLIDLLLGLSQPTEGQILIDGVPLREVLHAWRRRVGYVPQRVALFDASVAQNVALTWGNDYDADAVTTSLARAQLNSLIESRQQGIAERIGERGVSLSGGQQQRMGIARALYTDPLVLILDEATSSLDTKTEDDVTQAIRSLRGEVTLISVAHRLSTIKDYDQICYLEDGRIIGQGTFYEVARQVPAFAEQVALAGLGDGALVDPRGSRAGKTS